MFGNWLLEIWLISLAAIEIGCWHEEGLISTVSGGAEIPSLLSNASRYAWALSLCDTAAEACTTAVLQTLRGTIAECLGGRRL